MRGIFFFYFQYLLRSGDCPCVFYILYLLISIHVSKLYAEGVGGVDLGPPSSGDEECSLPAKRSQLDIHSAAQAAATAIKVETVRKRRKQIC